MNSQLPTLSGGQLHLWPIIREAIAFPWEYRHSLWKWVLVCGGLVGLVNFASEILNSPEVWDEYGLLATLIDIILQLFLVLTLYVIFCVRCHRFILLDSTTETDTFPPPLGEREGKFCRFILIMVTGLILIFFCGSGV